ncbi:hypothetical protein AOCH_006421 [Aspergillus ochraceoroseus]|uniref:Uncharacterized protein n=1 Tax=Aspergillus ochraceoroseus TaxID=138278 RepID=A0A0F8UXE0_9EURO|nr:hypothetical protein AOCH_006421 [Aspergillus ochraceoroseus]
MLRRIATPRRPPKDVVARETRRDEQTQSTSAGRPVDLATDDGHWRGLVGTTSTTTHPIKAVAVDLLSPDPGVPAPNPNPGCAIRIPLRRSMMTTSLYTPATSRANILAGSRRYAPSSATAEVLSEDPPPSPRQPVSQTKIVAPSTKLAASYTPISQNRLRTNSLGARRFGMRQRPIATAGNSKSFDNSID